MAPIAVQMAADLFAITTTDIYDDYYSQGLRKKFLIDGMKLPKTDSLPKPEPPADIGYDVDEEAFLRRCEASRASGGLPTSVPDGWPTRLEGPLVWSKNDFQNESEYVYNLTDADKAELETALKRFKEMGIDGTRVSRDTFVLPNFGHILDSICNEVYEGRGFVIVRGLDPDSYPIEDLTIVYLGISSYIGERRGKQDQRGSMLMHVIRHNDNRDDQYSETKPFHTDTVADCLCLFTQNLAESGGCSVVASAWTVYNELAATRPDLLHVLAEPNWPFDTYGRNPPYYSRSLMYYHDGKLITSFSRRLLVGHPPFSTRTPGIPCLTERQAEALDAVHFIAKRHEIKPRMFRGDLRFVNNMGLLHRREAFENSESNARHLVRLWLNNPTMCWKLPRDLRIAWARVFDDEDRDAHWDIEPPRKDGKILRVAGSCD
ncbi:hypothetical protein F4775DRAFT_227399 [Biscogniauxia sp. FL1348]|nr:hypothetical protein F4775DRAFT_227399 [Biscogniauxia sp. FL1348]